MSRAGCVHCIFVAPCNPPRVESSRPEFTLPTKQHHLHLALRNSFYNTCGSLVLIIGILACWSMCLPSSATHDRTRHGHCKSPWLGEAPAAIRTAIDRCCHCRAQMSACMWPRAPRLSGSSQVQPPPVLPERRSQRHTACNATKVNMRRMQKYKGNGSKGQDEPCKHIEVQADGSDAWRLDSLAELLENGAVRPSHPASTYRCAYGPCGMHHALGSWCTCF